MSSQGPLGCGTGANDAGIGVQAWSNPGNITADDGNYAVVASATLPYTSQYLKGTNCGFTIPSGATINGIVSEWKRFTNIGTVLDNAIRIVKGGVIGATELGLGAAWPTAEAYASYGGVSNLCGETWTDTDINSSGFGCALSCSGSANIANVNYLRITVYYTASGFDPGAGMGAFYRSQTRVLSVWQPNRSGMTAGPMELTLDVEPTRAFFVQARGVIPPPQRAPGAKTFRPDTTPPDQTPLIGWKTYISGQSPRGPWTPNRSTFVIPLERTPPFPDSWLTQTRPAIQPPVRGTPRTWFTLPLQREPPSPDSWLTDTRNGIWPQTRAGSTRRFELLKPFDFPLQNVLAKAPRLSWWGSQAFTAYVRPTDTPQPDITLIRPVQRIGRGSTWIVLADELAEEGELDAAKFLAMRAPFGPPFRARSWFSCLPDPTSTGILTLGWLKPLVARPIVRFGWPQGNTTAIAWTPQTIPTTSREDNRNATGRSGNNQTSTGLGDRDQTGIGTT